MKKALLMIISLLFIVGCGCGINTTAKEATKSYLNKYKMHDEAIMAELDTYVNNEDFTSEQKENYKNLLKKQYKDMKYEITDEEYNGDKATVTAKIIVYDLYKIQRDADNYLVDNREEFYDETGVYSITKFLDYKLDEMNKQDETVEYSINIELEKNDNGDWVVTQLSDEDLQKIHGVYNYE